MATPAAGWLRRFARKAVPTVDPLAQELRQTVQEARHAAILRQLQGPPADAATDQAARSLLEPVFKTAGEHIASALQKGEDPAHATAEAVKTVANAVAARELLEGIRQRDRTGPTTADPAAAVVETAKEASALHREAAETFRDLAEMERERRQEAEQTLGQAAQAAKAEEADRWQWMLSLMEKNHLTMLELVRESKQTALDLQQRQAEAEKAAQRAEFEARMARLEEAVRMREEMQTLLREMRDQVHEKDLAALQKEYAAREREWQAQLQVELAKHGITDPELRWKLAQVEQVEIDNEKRRKELDLEIEQKAEEAKAKAEFWTKLGEQAQAVGKRLADNSALLGQWLGAPRPNPRIPRNRDIEEAEQEG